MKAWKIVVFDDGRLTSTSLTDDNGGITYQVGVKVYPHIPKSPLFCFRSLREAKNTWSEWDWGKLRIYECEIEEFVMDHPIAYLCSWADELEQITKFWKEEKYWKGGLCAIRANMRRDVVLAQWVILERDVTPEGQ